jgi:hypothetical protein
MAWRISTSLTPGKERMSSRGWFLRYRLGTKAALRTWPGRHTLKVGRKSCMCYRFSARMTALTLGEVA